METPTSMPDSFEPDLAAARSVIETALDAGEVWLSEPSAKASIAAYGIPVAEVLADR